jgi:hypothetical protein
MTPPQCMHKSNNLNGLKFIQNETDAVLEVGKLRPIALFKRTSQKRSEQAQ